MLSGVRENPGRYDNLDYDYDYDNDNDNDNDRAGRGIRPVRNVFAPSPKAPTMRPAEVP